MEMISNIFLGGECYKNSIAIFLFAQLMRPRSFALPTTPSFLTTLAFFCAFGPLGEAGSSHKLALVIHRLCAIHQSPPI